MEIQQSLGNTIIMITHDVDEAVLLSDKIIMIVNGPNATIGEVLEIDLTQSRDRMLLADNPKYNHYRQQVLSFLYEKQRKLEPLLNTQKGHTLPKQQNYNAKKETA